MNTQITSRTIEFFDLYFLKTVIKDYRTGNILYPQITD